MPIMRASSWWKSVSSQPLASVPAAAPSRKAALMMPSHQPKAASKRAPSSDCSDGRATTSG